MAPIQAANIAEPPRGGELLRRHAVNTTSRARDPKSHTGALVALAVRYSSGDTLAWRWYGRRMGSDPPPILTVGRCPALVLQVSTQGSPHCISL